MKTSIDRETLLKPLTGENPAGEDMRYTEVYELIKRARSFDDPLDQGDWKTDLKVADWDAVISISIDALSEKTKDIQIVAWLTEALIMKDGFGGLASGLGTMNEVLETFWETLYPQIEDGDLDYRVAPLEFLNEKLWALIKQVPITDESKGAGYSWLKWEESRQVGYDADTRNKYGDIDEAKRQKRHEQIEEGMLTAEQFDAAVALSAPGFYVSVATDLRESRQEFARLDSLVDERFGNNAPRLAELGQAIEDCLHLVERISKEKGIDEAHGPGPEAPSPLVETVGDAAISRKEAGFEPVSELPGDQGASSGTGMVRSPTTPAPSQPAMATGSSSAWPNPLEDATPFEQGLWESALRTMNGGGLMKALESLLEASLLAPSIREKSRCRLFVGKLCLSAGRADLARPVFEQLNTTVEQLHLEQWESPVWIADVIGGLYECLTSGEPSDDDASLSQTLFQRLCTIDITRAMTFRR